MRGFSHLPPTLLSLVLILNNVPQTVQYLAPSPRWGHAAVLINNLIYFYGGKTGAPGVTRDGAENTNDLLVLDLSATFPLSSIPWTAISLPVSGPKTAYHAITYGGSGYNFVLLFGGLADPSLLNYTTPTDTTNATTDPLVAQTLNSDNTTATDPLTNQTLYTFDSAHTLWNHPPPPASTATSEPSRRIEHTLVTRQDTGTAYLFGGWPLTNDLYTLDTNAFTWTFVALPTAPTPRYHHTSTLLPDGRMIVLGGFDGTNMISMQQVWSFDTNVGKWSVANATGSSTPANRRDHVAVATKDGKIIIHGGTDVGFLTFYSDIAVLDCSANTYTWSTPKVGGKVPAGRYTHTATLAGTNMIIAFGFLADQTGDYNIYVLDTTNFTWVTTYNPANLQYTSSTSSNSGSSSDASSSSSTSAGVVAGATLAALAAVALLAAALFFLIRRRRRDKEEMLYTRRYEDTPAISYTHWGATPGRTPAPPIRKPPSKTSSPKPNADAGLVAATLFGKDAVWRRIGAGRRGSQSSESSADGDAHNNVEGEPSTIEPRFEVLRRSEELLRPTSGGDAQGNTVPSPTNSSNSTRVSSSPANTEPTAFLLPPPRGRRGVGGLQPSGKPSPASIMTDDLDLDGRAVPLDVGVRSYFVPRQKLFVVNPDTDGRSTSAGSLKSLKSEDGEK